MGVKKLSVHILKIFFTWLNRDDNISGNISICPDKSPKQVFNDVTYELNELLDKIEVQTANMSNPKRIIDMTSSSI